MSKPCSCWAGAVALHDSHCCFKHYDEITTRVTCGHDDDGMAVFRRSEKSRQPQGVLDSEVAE